jgi:phospholipase/carboxylesterase
MNPEDDPTPEAGGEIDAITGAIVAIIPPLLQALEALGFIGRHLHPPQLDHLITTVGARDAAVRAALEPFRDTAWPEQLTGFRERVEAACDATIKAFEGLRAAAPSGDMLQAYRALRYVSRALEALYPVASMLPLVSQFYLEEAARADTALRGRLVDADPSRENVGVMHAGNDRGMRGGFSLYVPEYYDPDRAHPLIMALHGGSGHGRAFLWSWIREARSRGAILVSPTAVGDTWSLMEPEIDAGNIAKMLQEIRQAWNVDPKHLLLTGMSDGGTFTLVSGMQETSPFTHLAPISAAFHPFLLELTDPNRVAGLPIYLTHGALDWMFPIEIARTADRTLKAAGADVTFREIADLSHTYPRDENPRIMDWFLRRG